MSKDYKQIDWAMDRKALADWDEQEDRLIDRINYFKKRSKKHHRRTER